VRGFVGAIQRQQAARELTALGIVAVGTRGDKDQVKELAEAISEEGE